MSKGNEAKNSAIPSAETTDELKAAQQRIAALEAKLTGRILGIPTDVNSVRWAEETMELRVVAECARDFVWEPENWEAYVESKESNSVAWPPEFLLMAQAVEKQYGPMPVEKE